MTENFVSPNIPAFLSPENLQLIKEKNQEKIWRKLKNGDRAGNIAS
jgi:hypothetical protein